MKSYQNLKILQNLYRLKSLGYTYTQPFQRNKETYTPPAHDLQGLSRQIADCHLCDLSKSRKQSMSGYGTSPAPVMFIDYVVSDMQDAANEYYCGRSGDMLKKMIQNVLELSIEEVYFTHALKCRPLPSKSSLEQEWMSCKSYLLSQIEFVRPKVIVTLGPEAFFSLTNAKNENFEELRGHITTFQNSKLVPIYHPNFVLRNPNLKKIVYNDLKTIKSCL